MKRFSKIGRYTDSQSHLDLFDCETGGDKRLIGAVQSLVGCEVQPTAGAVERLWPGKTAC